MEPLFKFFYPLVGAVGAVYFTPKAPTWIEKMKAMFPGWKEQTYVILDFAIVVFISALLGDLYAAPDPMKAIIAGFGAVTLLKQLIWSPK